MLHKYTALYCCSKVVTKEYFLWVYLLTVLNKKFSYCKQIMWQWETWKLWQMWTCISLLTAEAWCCSIHCTFFCHWHSEQSTVACYVPCPEATTWSHSRSLEMLRLNRTSITSFYWPVVTVSCKVYEIQYHYNFSILFPFNALDTSVRNQDSLGYSLLKIMQI